ncbi:MAG: adenylate/guanylate cyclase domain-containing protein [Acidimicrobiales bacterium]
MGAMQSAWELLLSNQEESGDDLVLHTLAQAFVGSPSFSEADLCAKAGVDPETARQLWAAMGFVAAEPGEVSFTQADLDALSKVHGGLAARPAEVVLQQTRVLSSLLARVAEVVAGSLSEDIASLHEMGMNDTEVAAAAIAQTQLLDTSGLIDYLFRRQLVTALARQLTNSPDEAGADEQAPVAVFFADLVGYTALSQEMTDSELAHLVTRFQSLANEVIGSGGGRVVKTLGDEVMVVCDDAAAATEMAARLVRMCAEDPDLPDLRVGLAYGPVLAIGGDYFGPTVNLASRLTGIARPGTMLASDAVHEEVPTLVSGKWDRLRVRRIKGIGWAAVWALKPLV